jgi:hypothetical protein
MLLRRESVSLGQFGWLLRSWLQTAVVWIRAMTCVAAAGVVHSLVICATGSSCWMGLLGVIW